MTATKNAAVLYVVYTRDGAGDQPGHTCEIGQLPERLRHLVESDPLAGSWETPALNQGDRGRPLDDLMDCVAWADGPDAPRADTAGEREAYHWGTTEQGYTGDYAEWLEMSYSARAEYEAGAAGLPTG